MTNYTSTYCTAPSSNSSYLQILKAPCGITLDGTHILDNYSNFASKTLTAVAGHSGAVTSTGTKSKQVGDLVNLAFNIVLTYNPDGSGDLNSITFEGIGATALKTSKHVNAFVEINAGTFESLGKAEVFENQLILTIPSGITFSTGVVYTLQGEIEYSTSTTTDTLCDTFIKRNYYYTTTGIQLGSTLLTQFTLWTPVVFTFTDNTIQVDTQYSFYRRLGDMTHIIFYIVYRYTIAPGTSDVVLETLPVTPISGTYTNVGLEWTTGTTYLQISNSTQLNVFRPSGITTIDTGITISGEIFYQSTTL